MEKNVQIDEFNWCLF